MSSNLIFALFGLALFAYIQLYFLVKLAERVGLLDWPSERKKHLNPTPLVGGLMLFISLWSATWVLDFSSKIFWVLTASTPLIFMGLLDDLLGLTVKTRLAFQILFASVFVLASGQTVHDLGVYALEPSEAAWIGAAIAIIAFVGFSNAFNMIDGLDGLAGILSLIALLSVSVASLNRSGSIPEWEFISALAVVLFLFVLVNLSLTPLPRIFLGDAGSMFLGFVIVWMYINLSQSPEASVNPLVCLWSAAIPVFDLCVTTGKRMIQGDSPFVGDRRHIHYLLIDRGCSNRLALLLICCFALLCAICGTILDAYMPAKISALSFISVFFLYVLVTSSYCLNYIFGYNSNADS